MKQNIMAPVIAALLITSSARADEPLTLTPEDQRELSVYLDDQPYKIAAPVKNWLAAKQAKAHEAKADAARKSEEERMNANSRAGK